MTRFSIINCILLILILQVQLVSAEQTFSTAETPDTGNKASYSVTSVPDGADVWFDGQYRGATPLIIEVSTDVLTGHSVSVRKQGFENWEKNYPENPMPNEVIQVKASLTPLKTVGFVVVVSSPPEASVTIDGSDSHKTPHTYAGVSPGSHTIQVAVEGYQPYSKTVQVQAGKTEYVFAALEQLYKTGRLEIRSTPSGADCFIDQDYCGKTPVTAEKVFSGMHTVKLTLSGYIPFSTEAKVSESTGSLVNAILEPLNMPPDSTEQTVNGALTPAITESTPTVMPAFVPTTQEKQQKITQKITQAVIATHKSGCENCVISVFTALCCALVFLFLKKRES